MISFCAVPLHKGGQQVFDMNAKIIFKETTVQSSFREVVEEGQQSVRMESFEYLFYMKMVFLNKCVGAYMCKASYVP